MLIKLTNRCNENCTHCMENSNPNGDNMTWEVLNSTIEFLKSTNVNVIIVSGGEVTEDPEFESKVTHILESFPDKIVTIQSNGAFIRDSNKVDSIKRLLRFDNLKYINISTNKKYYPNYEFTLSKKTNFLALGKKVNFDIDWQGNLTNLHRLGRARNLTNESFKGNPSCSPIVSRANQLDKMMRTDMPECLNSFFILLEMSGYLCKPMISEYGDIHISESTDCVKVGSIVGFDKLSEDERNKFKLDLLNKFINSHMCNKCNQLNNLKGKVPEIVLRTGSFSKI